MALGLTLTWLTLLILIPLSGLAVAFERAWLGQVLVDCPRSAHPERASHQFRRRFCRGLLSTPFSASSLRGCWCAYRFPGKRVIDAMVDLPFALPTAVAGIALTTLYAPNGWIGQFLTPLGIRIAFTPVGIVVALVFVGLPFVVRTVQPVMEEIDRRWRKLPQHSAPIASRRSSVSFFQPSRLPC